MLIAAGGPHQVVDFSKVVVSMHPSHLWLDSGSIIEMFDKTMLLGTPLWLISLDLSKAFDRVDWQAMWRALETHGVSQHLIWILQLLYDNQRGQVGTDTAESREFDIHRGVRQGCVLSPRLFCSVLEWALNKWRMRVRAEGID